VFLAIWVLLMGIFRLNIFAPDPFDIPEGTWAMKIAMLCHHVFVGPLAFANLFVDSAVWNSIVGFGWTQAASHLTRDDSGHAALAEALAPVTMGYMLADLSLIGYWQVQAKGGNQENILMVIHHFLSLASWPVAIQYDYCSRYLLFLISTEISSIFLTFKWMLSVVGVKAGTCFFLNGACFTISFVLLRNCASVVQILALIHKPPAFEAVDDVPVVLRWCGNIFLFFPHILNTVWGYKVVSGAFNLVVGKRRNAETDSTQKDAAE